MKTFAVVAKDQTHYVDLQEPEVIGPNFSWHTLAREEVVRLGLMTEEEARYAPIVVSAHPPAPKVNWR